MPEAVPRVAPTKAAVEKIILELLTNTRQVKVQRRRRRETGTGQVGCQSFDHIAKNNLD